MLESVVGPISDHDIKNIWTKAANTWRLPYWDWALPQKDTKQYGVPAILDKREVQVVNPDGSAFSLDNPLYRFVNTLDNEKIAMGDKKMGEFAVDFTAFPDFDRSIGTSRCSDPNSAAWVDGEQNNAKIQRVLKNPEWYKPKEPEDSQPLTGSIAHNLWRLFSKDYSATYEHFASTKWQQVTKATDSLSLEYLHNNIHGWTGAGPEVDNLDGHMAHVPVAAFDPIFWLHHCNIDRIFAIWQFLNTDKWFDARLDGDPPPEAALQPFHKDTDNHPHSSDDIRCCKSLGYLYPELVDTNVKKLRLEMYSKYGLEATEELKSLATEGDHSDYLVNIKYDRLALGGNPFYIRLFLGPKNEAGSFAERPYLLGSVYSFSSAAEMCLNCMDQQEQRVYSRAQIPISLQLTQLAKSATDPGMATLEPKAVEAFLKDNLWWDVKPLRGVDISAQDTSAALLHVVVEKGTPRYGWSSNETDGVIPHFHQNSYSPLYEVTAGKLAGATEQQAS
ncbi:hypothetical protein MMC25_007717 [Agyrium rufum]|nr:hypothetical protein [Agyrium rufum]